jgi:glycosyltransferase involved in cell wall biosynthesis
MINSSDEITIAVTVFNRRQFLKQAIASALEQKAKARVIVVEDCGPDPEMEQFVRGEFGATIDYFRNEKRRGLFDNWNACLERCRTPWLSILHDDDFLSPDFAQAMIELSRNAPNCGLYYGEALVVNDQGQPVACGARPPLRTPWRRVKLEENIEITPFGFPGHVFRVDSARKLGGFRASSQYCGDWEMWSALIAHYGAAQTSTLVAYQRSHDGPERGTNKIIRNGRLRPLTFVQQKRIVRMLREQGQPARFDRAEFLKKSPMSVSYLLQYGATLSPRLLRYHAGLLLRSTAPPSLPWALFRKATQVFGVPFVKAASKMAKHREAGLSGGRSTQTSSCKAATT